MDAPNPATAADVDGLIGLRDAAAAWLISRGIVQWAPGELDRETAAAQVAAGEWWVLRDDAGLVGALRLLWADPGVWGPRPDDAGYVHGLVVDRDRTGDGVGRHLLEWARARAADAGRAYLRLDCVETNAGLRAYYARAGFREVGRKEFDQWHPAVLLERATAET